MWFHFYSSFVNNKDHMSLNTSSWTNTGRLINVVSHFWEHSFQPEGQWNTRSNKQQQQQLFLLPLCNRKPFDTQDACTHKNKNHLNATQNKSVKCWFLLLTFVKISIIWKVISGQLFSCLTRSPNTWWLSHMAMLKVSKRVVFCTNILGFGLFKSLRRGPHPCWK